MNVEAELSVEGDAELLEYMIEHCFNQLAAAKTNALQLHWCERARYYMGKRSPETIAKMNREGTT